MHLPVSEIVIVFNEASVSEANTNGSMLAKS